MMGVKKVIISPGNGVDFPEKGDLVVLKWVEKMFGDVIDSSDSRGGSLTYQLGVGDLIRGWEVELPLMSLSEHASLEIPPDYACGEEGWREIIPPNTTLIYVIKLERIIRKDSQASQAYSPWYDSD